MLINFVVEPLKKKLTIAIIKCLSWEYVFFLNCILYHINVYINIWIKFNLLEKILNILNIKQL